MLVNTLENGEAVIIPNSEGSRTTPGELHLRKKVNDYWSYS